MAKNILDLTIKTTDNSTATVQAIEKSYKSLQKTVAEFVGLDFTISDNVINTIDNIKEKIDNIRSASFKLNVDTSDVEKAATDIMAATSAADTDAVVNVTADDQATPVIENLKKTETDKISIKVGIEQNELETGLNTIKSELDKIESGISIPIKISDDALSIVNDILTQIEVVKRSVEQKPDFEIKDGTKETLRNIKTAVNEITDKNKISFEIETDDTNVKTALSGIKTTLATLGERNYIPIQLANFVATPLKTISNTIARLTSTKRKKEITITLDDKTTTAYDKLETKIAKLQGRKGGGDPLANAYRTIKVNLRDFTGTEYTKLLKKIDEVSKAPKSIDALKVNNDSIKTLEQINKAIEQATGVKTIRFDVKTTGFEDLKGELDSIVKEKNIFFILDETKIKTRINEIITLIDTLTKNIHIIKIKLENTKDNTIDDINKILGNINNQIPLEINTFKALKQFKNFKNTIKLYQPTLNLKLNVEAANKELKTYLVEFNKFKSKDVNIQIKANNSEIVQATQSLYVLGETILYLPKKINISIITDNPQALNFLERFEAASRRAGRSAKQLGDDAKQAGTDTKKFGDDVDETFDDLGQSNTELTLLASLFVNVSSKIRIAINALRTFRIALDKLEASNKAQKAGLNQTTTSVQSFHKAIKQIRPQIDILKNAFALATPFIKALGLAIIGALAGLAAAKEVQQVSAAFTKLRDQLGLTRDELFKLQDVAIHVFEKGFINTIDEVNNVLAIVYSSFKDLKALSAETLEQMTTDTLILLQTFDNVDPKRLIGSAKTLVEQFGLSTQQAYDFLAKGFQEGLNNADDFLDTINEYSIQFSSAGADAGQFFSIIQSGMLAGMLGTDKAGDAFKEFRLRILDGSTLTAKGLAMIGLSVDELTRDLITGETTIADTFQLVINKLKEVDKATQSVAGTALIGTQAEDLGDTLLKIDDATTSLEDMDGAMNRSSNVSKTLAAAINSLWIVVKEFFVTLFTSESIAFTLIQLLEGITFWVGKAAHAFNFFIGLLKTAFSIVLTIGNAFGEVFSGEAFTNAEKSNKTLIEGYKKIRAEAITAGNSIRKLFGLKVDEANLFGGTEVNTKKVLTEAEQALTLLKRSIDKQTKILGLDKLVLFDNVQVSTNLSDALKSFDSFQNLLQTKADDNAIEQEIKIAFDVSGVRDVYVDLEIKELINNFNEGIITSEKFVTEFKKVNQVLLEYENEISGYDLSIIFDNINTSDINKSVTTLEEAFASLISKAKSSDEISLVLSKITLEAINASSKIALMKQELQFKKEAIILQELATATEQFATKSDQLVGSLAIMRSLVIDNATSLNDLESVLLNLGVSVANASNHVLSLSEPLKSTIEQTKALSDIDISNLTNQINSLKSAYDASLDSANNIHDKKISLIDTELTKETDHAAKLLQITRDSEKAQVALSADFQGKKRSTKYNIIKKQEYYDKLKMEDVSYYKHQLKELNQYLTNDDKLTQQYSRSKRTENEVYTKKRIELEKKFQDYKTEAANKDIGVLKSQLSEEEEDYKRRLKVALDYFKTKATNASVDFNTSKANIEKQRVLEQELSSKRTKILKEYYDGLKSLQSTALSNYQKYAERVKSFDEAIRQTRESKDAAIRDLNNALLSEEGQRIARTLRLNEIATEAEEALILEQYALAEKLSNERIALASAAATDENASEYSRRLAIEETADAYDLLEKVQQSQRDEAATLAKDQAQVYIDLSKTINDLTKQLGGLVGEKIVKIAAQIDSESFIKIKNQIDAFQNNLKAFDLDINLNTDLQKFKPIDLAEVIDFNSTEAVNELKVFLKQAQAINETIDVPIELEENSLNTVTKTISSLDGTASISVEIEQSSLDSAIAKIKRGFEAALKITGSVVTTPATNGYASGGWVSGAGGIDNIPAWLTKDEFVVNKTAAGYAGHSFLTALNNLSSPLPRFTMGGIVGNTSNANETIQSRDMVDINLHSGNKTVSLMAQRNQAKELLQVLKQSGGVI